MISQDSLERARAWIVSQGKRPIPNGVGGYRWVLVDVMPDERRPECLPAAVFRRLKSREEQPWKFATAREAGAAMLMAAAEAIEAGELDITK
jgi:hypothetical protein